MLPIVEGMGAIAVLEKLDLDIDNPCDLWLANAAPKYRRFTLVLINFMLGRTLRDRYYIIETIGAGGFGDTYLAKDLDRPRQALCVVKHLKPKTDDPAILLIARRLFQAEADILYRLKHDRIPQLLAHFEENSEFYLVQEYIEGDDLGKTELAIGNKLSEKEAIALLQDILEILVFVHQQNIIHRDLKPSNLMRRHQDGKLVLIDFGAVKEIQTLATTSQGQSQPHLTVAVGTRGYMPSEQSSGHPQLASDVYATGAIGIQALTGISPDQLATDPKTLELVWRERVRVSKRLGDILDKMVRYRFSDRYPSAVEALQAISILKPKQDNKLIVGGAIAAAIIGASAAFLPKIYEICCQAPVEFAQYQNSEYGIELKYPKNWSKQAGTFPVSSELVIFQSPLESNSDAFQEQVIVNVAMVENSVLLDDYTTQLIGNLRSSLTNFELSKRCETGIILASGETKTVCYTAEESGRKLKYLLTLTSNGDRIYYITYVAEPDKYAIVLESAKQMMKSFQFVETN